MDKVGVVVKLFLDVIRFLCENGKETVKVLQGIFRRLQQGLAVREAAEFAGGGKNPGIDQIRKDGIHHFYEVMIDIQYSVCYILYKAYISNDRI